MVASNTLSDDVVATGFLDAFRPSISAGCYFMNPDYPDASTIKLIPKEQSTFMLDKYTTCTTDRKYIVISGATHQDMRLEFGKNPNIQFVK